MAKKANRQYGSKLNYQTMNDSKNSELWLAGFALTLVAGLVALFVLMPNDEMLPRLWNRSFQSIQYRQGQNTITLEKETGFFEDKFFIKYGMANSEPLRRPATASVRMIFSDFESPIRKGEYVLNEDQVNTYFEDEICFSLFKKSNSKSQVFCKGKNVQGSTYCRLAEEPNRVYLVANTMFQFYDMQPAQLVERRVFILPTATVVNRILIHEQNKPKIEIIRKVTKDADNRISSVRWLNVFSNSYEQDVVSSEVENLLSLIFSLQRQEFLTQSQEQNLPKPNMVYNIELDLVIESPVTKNPFGSEAIGKTTLNIEILKINNHYFLKSSDGLDRLSYEQMKKLAVKLNDFR